MRQKLLFLLAAMVVFLPLRLSAFKYTYEDVTLNYSIIDEEAKSCCVDGSYESLSGAIVIPEVANNGIEDYFVTEIRWAAFEKCTGLTTVVIPNSVTKIGWEAFYGCSGLIAMEIPNSVESIGERAFRYCSALTSVVIGNSVTSIGDDAFNDCEALTSVEIPNSVISIGENAFHSCRGLTSVVIGNSVTEIGANAFRNCGGLIKSTYPNRLTNPFERGIVIAYDPVGAFIEDGFVYGPDKSAIYFAPLSLEGEFSIPESVTSIGDDAFRDCKGLTSVVIPNSVASIGASAFSECSGVTSIVIPNSITSISDEAFSGCSGLTSVVIPNSVTSIGPSAFSGCSGLTSIVIPDSVTSIGPSAFFKCSGLISVEIPKSVTSIGAYAFSECCALTSVEIPKSVTSIGDSAFSGCSGLTSVVIPNSVTEIGANAFSNCGGLTKSAYPSGLTNPFERGIVIAYDPVGAIIENDYIWGPDKSAIYFAPLSLTGEFSIPESVTSIGDEAFRDCTGLTSVVIPNSVTEIGECAFSGCIGLTSVVIPNSVTEISDETFRSCRGLTSVVIPNTIISIGKYAFSNCDGLTSVVIPNSVTSIGKLAFNGCSGMTSIVISNSVTEIGWCVFKNCSGLTSVVIPNSVTEIEYGAFSGCSGLTSVVIPNSVTEIDAVAFINCDGLIKSAYPSGLSNPFENGTAVAYNPEGAIIEDGWIWGPEKTEIRFVPYDLEGEYTIPESVTSIGTSAFLECRGLTTVVIPNSVTSIGASAFSECSGLTSVVIPNSVTNIGTGAFNGCSGLIKSAYPNGIINPFENGTAVAYNPEGAIIEDGWIWGPEKTEIRFVPYDLEGEYSIPESVTSIGASAFLECRSLTSVVIPNSVTSIGAYAFAESSFSSITIPEKVNEIKDFTFYNCTSLTDIKLSSTLKSIGASAFAMEDYNEVGRIESLTIPATLQSIGANAFLNRGIGKVTITDLRAWCDIDFSNYDSNPCLRSKEGLWLCDNKIVELEIPDGVEVIKPYSFVTQGKLESVKIPSSVTSIGRGAFTKNRFREIVIPSSVRYIGQWAFIAWDSPILPENTIDKTVNWSSSDESVSVVDENGDMTVLGAGKVTIVASYGELTSECTLKCYPQTGDANWNGNITIADAVDITNYVVKKKTAPKDWEEDEWIELYTVGANANESEDGDITFADASAVVSLALAQLSDVSAQNRITAAYSDSNESLDALVISAPSETNDGKTMVTVKLDNSGEYVALQADLFFPDGMDIELKACSRAACHSLETMRHNDNHIRVALFNLGNKAFAEGNGALFEIVADGPMSDFDGLIISNILASDSDANEYKLASRIEVATGVHGVGYEPVTIGKDTYGIHISNAIGKRIDIFTMEGQTVKSFIAKDNLEIINLPGGIYIVKVGDRTLKVIL